LLTLEFTVSQAESGRSTGMALLKRLFTACLMLALRAGVVHSDSPTFVTIQLNRTFISPSFSASCGFEVDITQVVVLKGVVFHEVMERRPSGRSTPSQGSS
jgi:hypothetical protein